MRCVECKQVVAKYDCDRCCSRECWARLRARKRIADFNPHADYRDAPGATESQLYVMMLAEFRPQLRGLATRLIYHVAKKIRKHRYDNNLPGPRNQYDH